MSDSKVPSHERCLLACAMRGGSKVREKILDAAVPEMFSEYRKIAEVVLPLAEKGRPAPDTVKAKLGSSSRWLEEVVEVSPAPTAYETHLEEVAGAYAEREHWALSKEIQDRLGKGESWEEVASMTQDRIEDIRKTLDDGNTKHIKSATGEALRQIERRQGPGVTGIPTSIPKFSQMIDGWRTETHSIIAARPSMGKTALALSEVLHAACEEEVPVAMFSLEMGRTQLAERMLAQRARVDARSPLSEPDEKRLRKAKAEIDQAPIYIDDGVHLGPMNLKARARQMQSEVGVGLVVIDYLQLMRSPQGREFNSRNKALGAIARENKKTAKTLGLPIISLAQLNRGVEKRNPPRPQLSDLRDSGEIEEHTDIAAFLYRAEYYGITVDAQGNSTEGIGEIMLEKQRNGPTGRVYAAFVEKHAAWEPLDNRSGGGNFPH